MSVYLWILLGVAVLIGVCRLAFLAEAISVTYQMLKGRHPNIRKGAFWGTASILSEATIQTINYQRALDHEHAMNESNGHDGISHQGAYSGSVSGSSHGDGISHNG
ncbi:hypothetical protein [Armatimonas sp.]|uniref:hypothetical protein n=1 Tax=Armatimonas sp. TaxID=1872638 RepID=UPI00286A0F3E|nr:hypothetical protein [Armatimonas sp.]